MNYLVRSQREIGLRGSLLDFVRRAWPIVEPGSRFIDGWHIGAMCERLEEVSKRTTRRLVINVPPGCMKSLTTSVFWPTWQWIRDPGARFIVASFDAGLTLRDARKSLEIIRSPWFQERWGDLFKIPAVVAESDFSNSLAGFRFSTSVQGKVTGRHADFQIIDDPIKPQEVSKRALDECETWLKGTMASRWRDPATGARVVIMQRLHERDLAGICEEAGYDVLRLPMRFEPKAWTKGDPRKEPGELLWPEHVPEEAVKDLEKEMGSAVAAAQLQQRPVPEGGAIFKREWFRYWSVLPARFDQFLQSWDMAFKGTDGADYVVGQVWGRKGADFFLTDQIKERLDFPGTLAAVRSFSRRYPKAIKKLVEVKANGQAVIDSLKKEIPGFIPVVPDGGKEARANAVAPLHEAGNVYYPDPKLFPWVDEHVQSMISFPKGKNDDDVDAETQALNYLYQKKTRFAEAMARIRGGFQC